MSRLGDLLLRRHGPLRQELELAPGGAGIGMVPARSVPNASATMVCGFCSTGCSLTVHLKDGRPVNITPTGGYPVNLGMACPKGWEALAPLAAGDRAHEPLVRRDGRLEPATWAVALRTFVDRVRAVQQKHGPHSVAFISTGQIVTEEMAFLGALAKFGMGLRHGDGNTRQCMATSVVSYKQSFGFDAPPYTYADFEQSDVIVLVGSNLCVAHPILWQRVCKNPHRPTIVVIDPRATETAMSATLHLPIRPKSDLPLLYGLAHILCERGWIDEAFIRDHTTAFEPFRAHLAEFTPALTAARTGIAEKEIERLAEIIHRGKRVSFWWTMGVNQSHEGTRVAQAIINLALMTGNIGRPGTGANSITGQCNAMGSRLFSNTTSLLGGRNFADPTARSEVARGLAIPEERIPHDAGFAYDQIIEGIADGSIRGLWVIGTNPAHSWIHQDRLIDLFRRLDLLVVQDMYTTTETASLADLLLPAAGWGEKDGTFINSERRIGLVRKVARAPGQALADFHIFRAIAESWGCSDMFRAWRTPEAVFQLLASLSRGQPCDMSGITGYRMLEERGGVQWPFPSGAEPEALASERRLFEDGRFYHPDGRARFLFDPPHPVPEEVTTSYPFILLTGRGSSAQWHTQTRTGKSAVLRSLAPAEIYIEINPADARRLGIQPGQLVHVTSRRARIRARAALTPTVKPGEVFVPMHYATANRLTFPAFDPHSRQPSYKYCAVALEVEDQDKS
jgi:anaerobic selenocysteine-containing dehydrogenase